MSSIKKNTKYYFQVQYFWSVKEHILLQNNLSLIKVYSISIPQLTLIGNQNSEELDEIMLYTNNLFTSHPKHTK